MTTDLLLLYIREDGVFARLLKNGERFCAEAHETVSEETLRSVLGTVTRTLSDQVELSPRSVTAAYVLSKRTEVLSVLVSAALSKRTYIDSVTELRRDEIYYVSTAVLSEEAPRQVLYCGSRETRLFTEEGEFAFPSGVTGGNGFLDWLLGFAELEGDSLEYFLRQTERLTELFRVYRCFRPASRIASPRETRLFPNAEAHPILSTRPEAPKNREEREGEKGLILKKRKKTVSDKQDADIEPPIRYYALSDADREKVDRKYPALYRAVRDKRGNYRQVSMGEAAEAFLSLFGNIKEAPITCLTVAGQYARFPLTAELLSSIGNDVQISYDSESRILLDGMERAVKDRICDSRLSVCDIDGREIVLWDVTDDESCPEKRVSFPASLKATVSREEWRRRTPLLPYVLEMTEPKKQEDGTFLYERRTIKGDLREACYKKEKDGSYRLSLDLPESQSAFRTVLLCIGATPDGVCCHLEVE